MPADKVEHVVAEQHHLATQQHVCYHQQSRHLQRSALVECSEFEGEVGPEGSGLDWEEASAGSGAEGKAPVEEDEDGETVDCKEHSQQRSHPMSIVYVIMLFD